jgi:hypothetical protein
LSATQLAGTSFSANAGCSARSCCFFTYADLSGVMPSRAKLGLVYELRETASEAGQAALREHTLLGDDADSTNVR